MTHKTFYKLTTMLVIIYIYIKKVMDFTYFCKWLLINFNKKNMFDFYIIYEMKILTLLYIEIN